MFSTGLANPDLHVSCTWRLASWTKVRFIFTSLNSNFFFLKLKKFKITFIGTKFKCINSCACYTVLQIGLVFTIFFHSQSQYVTFGSERDHISLTEARFGYGFDVFFKFDFLKTFVASQIPKTGLFVDTSSQHRRPIKRYGYRSQTGIVTKNRGQLFFIVWGPQADNPIWVR